MKRILLLCVALMLVLQTVASAATGSEVAAFRKEIAGSEMWGQIQADFGQKGLLIASRQVDMATELIDSATVTMAVMPVYDVNDSFSGQVQFIKENEVWTYLYTELEEQVDGSVNFSITNLETGDKRTGNVDANGIFSMLSTYSYSGSATTVIKCLVARMLEFRFKYFLPNPNVSERWTYLYDKLQAVAWSNAFESCAPPTETVLPVEPVVTEPTVTAPTDTTTTDTTTTDTTTTTTAP